MPLQWGTVQPPNFPVNGTTHVTMSTTDGDDHVYTSFDVSFGVEGPDLTEEQVLGYLQILYDAYTGAGWTVEMGQSANAGRVVEEVP